MKQAPPKRTWTEQIALSAKDLFSRHLMGRELDVSPVLVVGCGHSGTTLLLAMLGAHPWLYPVTYETNFGFMNPDDAVACLRGIRKEALANGKRGWVEKTPKHILCIPRLLEYVPTAKVILLIRDGRDVAFSIKKRTGSLDKGIRRWVEQNREGERYWGLESVFRLKYEELVQNPEVCLEDLCTLVGIPYSSAMLEYHKHSLHYYTSSVHKPDSPAGENHAQYRNWQINQPVFDGRGKWKEMTESEKKLIKERAGSMLIEYGYAIDGSW